MSRAPQLAVVVAVRNMAREAPRTLYTLSTTYQRGVDESDYEVVVVDCGSQVPLERALVEGFGCHFRLMRDDDQPSPAGPINRAVRSCTAPVVVVCIDGARMLSPGILALTLAAFRAFGAPVVGTLGWHLGPSKQQLAMLDGYDQAVEDRLLETVNWRSNGYELFGIAALGGSAGAGWFRPLGESNCIAVDRSLYWDLGGLDERFGLRGGGFVNLDFYRRACLEGGRLVLLLGEGTFHQFHGGISTNVPEGDQARAGFGRAMAEEYRALRGDWFVPPDVPAIYLGTVPHQALRFVELSVARAQAQAHI
jgi:hypothetical protein